MQPVESPLAEEDRKPVILLVEDEVIVSFATAEHLRENGCVVIEARNAREAIDVLFGETRIDLVITDVMMPESMDGFGLAKWIETNRPDLPFILTSGVPRNPAVLTDKEMAWPFLPKPYDLDALHVMVRRLLGPAGKEASK